MNQLDVVVMVEKKVSGSQKGSGLKSDDMRSRLLQESPEQMRSFFGLVDACEKDGVLTRKTKELISVALSVKAQCCPCIMAHVRNARDSGASRAEIIEASWVAVLMGGGPSYAYLAEVMKALDELGVK